MSLPRAFASAFALLILGARPATAGDARWAPGEAHRWYLEHSHELPQLLWALGPESRDVRLLAVQLRLIVSCAAGGEDGLNREVLCTIEDAAVAGRGVEGEAEALDGVLHEMDRVLTGARWRFEVDRAGRLHDADLLDAPQIGVRDTRFHGLVRLLLGSAMAGLEVAPPPGRKATLPTGPGAEWVVDAPAITRFPVPTGTLGSFRLRRQALDADESLVRTVSYGVGAISPGNTRLTMVTRAGDDAWLDRGTGRLVHRQWWVVGRATPSSETTRTRDLAGPVTALSGPFGIGAWRQGGYLARLGGDAPEPQVGDSGVSAWRQGGSTAMLDRAEAPEWSDRFPRPDGALWASPPAPVSTPRSPRS